MCQTLFQRKEFVINYSLKQEIKVFGQEHLEHYVIHIKIRNEYHSLVSFALNSAEYEMAQLFLVATVNHVKHLVSEDYSLNQIVDWIDDKWHVRDWYTRLDLPLIIRFISQWNLDFEKQSKLVAEIKWYEEDLLNVFDEVGIKNTPKNIKIVKQRAEKVLCDRSVEEGWYILRDLVTTIQDELN